MGWTRPRNGQATPVAEKEDAAPFLGDAVFLGAEYPGVHVVSELGQFGKNSLDGMPAPRGGDAGDVLHHDPLRPQPLDDAQVLVEQPAALVMHAALVVVDAERLAGRAADQAVQFTLREPRGVKDVPGGNIFDRAGKKRRFGVARGERFGGVRVDVVTRQNPETGLAENPRRGRPRRRTGQSPCGSRRSPPFRRRARRSLRFRPGARQGERKLQRPLPVAFQKLGDGPPAKPGQGYAMLLGKCRKLGVLLLRDADGNARFRGHVNRVRRSGLRHAAAW